MNCHELATVEHYHLPIITVIFNNGCLGMVRQWQNLLYHQRFSQTTLDRGPDFVKLAEAYGLKGFRVSTRAEMEQLGSRASRRGAAVSSTAPGYGRDGPAYGGRGAISPTFC